MKKLLRIPAILFLAIVVFECNNVEKKSVENEKNEAQQDSSDVFVNNDPIETTENYLDSTISNKKEEFGTFYKKFTTDYKFQDSRIQYPLEGLYYNSSMGDVDDASYTWTREDKLKYDIEDIDLNIYKVEREESDTLIIEKIFIENSGFQMETHFKLIDSSWYMVYYSFINV